MGGSGGQRARAKSKSATLGGKFDSIGSASDQKANLALVTRLLSEVVGVYKWRLRVDQNDIYFIEDCKIKMNQAGSGAMFGWGQVQKMVAIHKKVVTDVLHPHDTNSQLNAQLSRSSPVGRDTQARVTEGGDAPLGAPSTGGGGGGGNRDASPPLDPRYNRPDAGTRPYDIRSGQPINRRIGPGRPTR